jgi:predicted nucleotidyltransferase
MGDDVPVERDTLLDLLRAHAPDCAHFGVRSLALFGSVARGEARADSDVDVLVDFDGPATFDRYMGLKFYLEDLLGRRVDLVTRRGLRDDLRPAVESEAIRVA